jgi:uncharacterized protein
VIWEHFEVALEDICPYTKLVQYEWDPAKALSNLKKHGVSFADAVAVFEDEFALTREDADAHEEQRFVTLGMDATGDLLVVVYAYRGSKSIRLISAWRADRNQRKLYESRRR